MGAEGDRGVGGWEPKIVSGKPRFWQREAMYLSGRGWGWGFGLLGKPSYKDADEPGHGQPHRLHLGEQPDITGW